ncbi:Fic family protein [Dasania marina]|uniref:Fic family protein n=1 Tax=Dasania marina TaxID=471499 RepID=UPI0030DB3FA6|tara:strand:+ start:5428 stop:6240 length:813 start_codon:yes stop_codon:yes gene_type:complete
MNREEYNNLFPAKYYSIAMAKRDIPALVTDAVQLEGLAFTLPEVQTIIDGVTVGGHKISDQQIVINQAQAWKKLLSDSEQGQFEVSKEYAASLHAVAAFQEALTWGEFRSSQVTISGVKYTPPPVGDLDESWQSTMKICTSETKVFESAVGLYGDMARAQFFFDVNKRTARMMMAGVLLENGLPIFNVKHLHQNEFNTAMIEFYESNNKEFLYEFFEKYCIDELICSPLREKAFSKEFNIPPSERALSKIKSFAGSADRQSHSQGTEQEP